MEQNICRLIVIFEKLGLEIKTEKFDNRLINQKIVYFLQFTGIDLGYRFSWYIYGPYSSALSDSTFSYDKDKSEYKKNAKLYSISEQGHKKIDKLRNFLSIENSKIEPEWIEILASIHFLKHIAYDNENVYRNNIQTKLIESGKDHFESKKILRAWDYLDEKGLIQNKTFS